MYNKKILQYHSTLGKYTNEVFGLEYLYEQSEPGSHLFRASVEEPTEDDDEQDDEEHEDERFEDETSFFSPSQDKDLAKEQEEVYTDLHNM